MTPLKQKWKEIKEQNPNTIIFVRIGKFYEVFQNDALVLNRVFQAPLLDNTQHTGFPASCLPKFIKGLQEAGHKNIRLI